MHPRLKIQIQTLKFVPKMKNYLKSYLEIERDEKKPKRYPSSLSNKGCE